MRTRLIALPALAVALVFSVAASALAAAPPSSPAVIQSVTFESSSPSDTLEVDNAYNPDDAPLDAPKWGAIAAQRHSGSYGLWCAGSLPGAYPDYPAGTHGIAYFRVLDAADWDESYISFSYIEPSRKALDGPLNPFRVSWGDGSREPTASTLPTGYVDANLPLAATWRTVSIQRGVFGAPPLDSGWFRFSFLSKPDAIGAGQGVTIDDIAVTGYKYGAVNNLTAARQHGDLSTVVVDWDAPYARGTGTPDSRDIWYRVWRHDMSANTWTEVTTSRVATTTFTDSGVPLAGTYQYTVQGWDASGETAWGKNATSGSVQQAVPQFISASVAPTSVKYGGQSTVRAVLLDEVGELWGSRQASIGIQRRLSGGSWTTIAGGVSEIATGTYSAIVQSTVSADYRLYHQTSGVGSGPVHVTAAPYLTSPSTPSKVKRNRYFTVSGKVSGVPGVSRSVTLRLYRKKSSSVWVLSSSTVVRVSASSGVVSYKKAMRVKSKGAYRATATVADVHSAWTKSGYRYFSAK